MLDPANLKVWDGTSTRMTSLINNGINNITNGPYGYDTSTYSVPVMTINNALLSTATSTCTVVLSTPDLNALELTNNLTVMFAAKKNYYGYSGNNNGNSELFQAVNNGYNTGWRISESNQSPVIPISTGAAFTGTHAWYFGFTETSGNTIYMTDTASTNRMCICAASLSPTTFTAFVNGTFNQHTNTGGYVPGSSQPIISFTGAGAGSFNGMIGFFMIYNRALTNAEIQQNFNALRGRYNL
jgi:hypothetical protein